MNRTVEIRLGWLIAAGFALIVLGLVVGWKFLPSGEQGVRVVKQDGDIEIGLDDEVGIFESTTGEVSVSGFIVGDLYWEDGSKSGFGRPPCLEDNTFGHVHAGVVYVDGPSAHHQLAWVRCP